MIDIPANDPAHVTIRMPSPQGTASPTPASTPRTAVENQQEKLVNGISHPAMGCAQTVSPFLPSMVTKMLSVTLLPTVLSVSAAASTMKMAVDAAAQKLLIAASQ